MIGYALPMRIALAQVNPTVGDVDGNTELCVRAAHLAGERGADVVVLPELVICGYPPKDLLLAEGFIAACERAVLRIAKRLPRGMTAILGTPLRGRVRGRIGNGLVALRDGKIVARYHKRLLPTYDVFDEDRYFAPGDEAVVLRVKGKAVKRPQRSLADLLVLETADAQEYLKTSAKR